jgi:resuscitation-promoting factor RpfB
MSSPFRNAAQGHSGQYSIRSLLTLLLAAVVVPLAGFPPSVAFDVDGRTVVARAAVSTVADAASIAGLDLGPGDRLDPRPATLAGGRLQAMPVQVERGVVVEVVVDGGRPRLVRTADATVEGALRAADLLATLSPQALIEPDRRTGLVDGDVIVITEPQQLSVEVEGRVLSIWTAASTVGEALRDLDLEVSLLDRISPSPDTPIGATETVQISRVSIEEQQVDVVLPRPRERIEDGTLLRGVVRVAQAGRDGLRRDTLLVSRVEGEIEARIVLAREVLQEPVPRIERVGTRATAGEGIWDALARCESGGRWDAVRRISATTTYEGGLQFHSQTWSAYRLADFPARASEATREQQIMVAERVLQRQGWGAWPSCARRLGLR